MSLRHLDLLNVVLAWRFAQPGWPRCLASCGYLVHGIGVSVLLPDRGEISPDVLASKADVTLLIEVKSGSGRNFEYDQLGRMESCTPEHLRDFAHLHIPDVAKHQVGVVYVCNEEHAEEIAQASEGRASVVGFDGSRFSITGVPLPDTAFTAELRSCSVDRKALPLAIVPFDRDTPLPEVAAVVLPEVVAALVRGAGQISTEGILERTHAVCHDMMRPTGAGSEKKYIVRRVAEVLQAAASEDLRDWIERVPGKPVYRFRAALSLDPAARTRALKALQKSAGELITRLGGAVQLPLEFDDL